MIIINLETNSTKILLELIEIMDTMTKELIKITLIWEGSQWVWVWEVDHSL